MEKKEESKADSDAGSETSGSSKKTGELLTLDPRDRNEREEERLFGIKKTGINFDKYDDVQVECSGDGIPDPVLSFEDAHFHSVIHTYP